MASYKAAQIRRLMPAIIALPARTSRRSSQCSTISAATSATRFWAPTIASTRAQRVFSFSRVSTSASSVTSSNRPRGQSCRAPGAPPGGGGGTGACRQRTGAGRLTTRPDLTGEELDPRPGRGSAAGTALFARSVT
jgi:hypothetical protein